MKATSRRKFIMTSALTAGAVAAGAALPSVSAPNQFPVIHHVFFWLKNPESKEDLQKLIEGVKTLSKIEHVNNLRVGIEAATKQRDVTDKSWAVSELIFFKDLAAQAAYQDHPVHLEFIKNYGHLWEKVVVYDIQDV